VAREQPLAACPASGDRGREKRRLRLTGWGSANVVVDERLRSWFLVDNDKAVSTLNDVFKSGVLVTGHKSETIVLGADELVFVQGHLDVRLTCDLFLRTPALAEKFECRLLAREA
jgi:hypothetical protein